MSFVITVLGECVIDLIESEVAQTFTAHVGGSPLNVAIGVRRLGHSTALMTRFGNDRFGRMAADHASTELLDLSAAVTAPQATSLSFVTKDSAGAASYDFYLDGAADWQWTAAELAHVPAPTTLLHTGSLSTVLLPSACVIEQLMSRIRQDGDVLLTYDPNIRHPNIRPGLAGSHADIVGRVQACIRSSHVVKASVEDVSQLYPGASLDDAGLREIAGRWLELGPMLVVITRGPDGATAFCADGTTITRPALPISVVDTVGAGDAFMAGLIDGLVHRGATSQHLGEVLACSLAELIDDAIAVSALTCQRAGADPPTHHEVAAFAFQRLNRD